MDIIPPLIFINRNTKVTQPEKYIDILEVSTVIIQDKIDDIESSVELSKESNYKD